MNKNIIYLKEASNYEDVLKKESTKLPRFFEKIIYRYKNIFNIIIRKRIEGINIWILPIKETEHTNKIKKVIKRKLINTENMYVLSAKLINSSIQEIMDKYEVKYITQEKSKKILLINILKYIANVQNKEISDFDITILVNNTSSINMFVIEKIAKQVKNLKIVSLNIYKFKKIEEQLYNEYGIPIQFSNSYRKSLEKSKLIINLDFNESEINEYEIFDKAIIINCVQEKLKIKTRLFNGIIINSYDIKFEDEIINKLKKMKIYNEYKSLLIYASIIENEENIFKINNNLKLNNIEITGVIGNSGIISKNEFKNIFKKLDKNQKTE